MNSALVRVDGLAYRYTRTWVLNGVSFEVSEGQVIGLFGPNGAGKSTLLQLMCGLLAPGRGTLRVCGVEWSAGTWQLAPLAVRYRLSRDVVYCPDQGGLYPNLTPRAHGTWMTAVADGFDMSTYMELLDRLNVGADQPVESLSKGQRARVRLALALSRPGRLLLLDEPLSGFDPASRVMVQALLRDVLTVRGAAAIISTHEIGEIETLLERVWVIADGRLTVDAHADDLRGRTGRSLEQWAREGMRA